MSSDHSPHVVSTAATIALDLQPSDGGRKKSLRDLVEVHRRLVKEKQKKLNQIDLQQRQIEQELGRKHKELCEKQGEFKSTLTECRAMEDKLREMENKLRATALLSEGGGSDGPSSELFSSAVPLSITTSSLPCAPPILVDVTKPQAVQPAETARAADEGDETMQDGSHDEESGSSKSASKSSATPARASTRPSRSTRTSSSLPAGPSSKRRRSALGAGESTGDGGGASGRSPGTVSAQVATASSSNNAARRDEVAPVAVRDAVLAAPTAETDPEKPMTRIEMARRLVYAAHGRAGHGLDPKAALQFQQKVVAASEELMLHSPVVSGVVYRKAMIDAGRESPQLISRMHPQFTAATSICMQARSTFGNLSRKIERTFTGNMDGLTSGYDSYGRAYFRFA